MGERERDAGARGALSPVSGASRDGRPLAYHRAPAPDLAPWLARLFVTAVGLGPFPGGLALAVHSIGMMGRLFAETIEHMDMAPIDALSLTG